MNVRVVVAPVAEQISLEDARLHLRVDANEDSPPTHPDDSLIEAQIAAAREWCEGWLARSLATQTLELALDAFPSGAIELEGSPVQSIVSVKYLDAAGAEQTVDAADYRLDNYSEPATLAPVTSWAATNGTTNNVKVRYVAGFTFDGDSPSWPFPASIRAAQLLVLGSLYENREQSSSIKLDDIPLGARALLLPWRLRLSMA